MTLQLSVCFDVSVVRLGVKKICKVGERGSAGDVPFSAHRGRVLIIRRGRYSSLCSRASQRSRTWPGIHYNPQRESDEGTDAVSEEWAG